MGRLLGDLGMDVLPPIQGPKPLPPPNPSPPPSEGWRTARGFMGGSTRRKVKGKACLFSHQPSQVIRGVVASYAPLILGQVSLFGSMDRPGPVSRGSRIALSPLSDPSA